MSKKPLYNKDFNFKAQQSPKQLHRRGIHDKYKIYEKENYDEESDENLSSSEGLYPDLSEDLKVLPNRLHDVKKKQKECYESKPLKAEKKPIENESSSGIVKFIITIICILLSVALFGYRFLAPASSSERKNTNLVDLFRDMENHFQKQENETFKRLKIALKDVVNEEYEPSAPAIVTIITNKNGANTASDFSIYLAKKLANGQYVSINESAFHGSPEDLKYKIDVEIKSKFKSKKELSVVIIDRLQNIPFEAAMLFHSYCDHENAPYKRAVFLFILHLDMNISENHKLLDDIAMKGLRNIWHKFTDDEVDSLITRMTNSVVKIK